MTDAQVGVYCQIGTGHTKSAIYPAAVGMVTSCHGPIVAVSDGTITTQWTAFAAPRIHTKPLKVPALFIRARYGEPKQEQR